MDKGWIVETRVKEYIEKKNVENQLLLLQKKLVLLRNCKKNMYYN